MTQHIYKQTNTKASDNGTSIKDVLKELKGNGRCPYAN